MSDTRNVIAIWSASGHPVGLFDYSLADELLAALAAAGKKVVDVGEVVPAAEVLKVAQQLERDSDGRASFLAIANWLRALVERGGPGAHAD